MRKKDTQYSTNFWNYFVDKKTKQFYDNFCKQDLLRQTFHLTFMTIIQTVILLSLKKQSGQAQFNEISILTIVSATIGLLIVKKKPNFRNYVFLFLNTLSAIDILTIQDQSVYESDTEFALKLIFILFNLAIRNLVNQYNWVDQLQQNMMVYLIVIPSWLFYNNKISMGKMHMLIFCAIFVQAFIFISISLIEQRLKKMWADYETLRKSQKTYEQLLSELPVPLIAFSKEGKVLMQNQLAFRLIPKDVDLISKKFSNKQVTVDQLIINADDLIKFRDCINKTLESDELEYLEIVLTDHPYPQLCYFQKIIWKRQQSVLVTFVEQGDYQQNLFNNLGPGSQLFAFNSMNNIAKPSLVNIEEVKKQEFQTSQEDVENKSRSSSIQQIPQKEMTSPQRRQRQQSKIFSPRKQSQDVIRPFQDIQEESCNLQSENEQSLTMMRKKKVLSVINNVGEYSFNPPSLPKIPLLSEEEKQQNIKKKSEPMAIQSPSLSPIPMLFQKKKNKMKEFHQIDTPKATKLNKADNKFEVNGVQESENFDVNEKINQYMHYIEKGFSKTIENLLTDIMAHEASGKKLNIQFKSSKKRNLKNFETSPEQSEQQNKEPFSYNNRHKFSEQSKKPQTTEYTNKPSLFKQFQSPNIDEEETQKPQIKRQETLQSQTQIKVQSMTEFPSVLDRPIKFTKQTKNKNSSLLTFLREDDVGQANGYQIQQTTITSNNQINISEPQSSELIAFKNDATSPQFRSSSQTKIQDKNFSFQKIQSPVSKTRPSLPTIEEPIEDLLLAPPIVHDCSVMIQPKFTLCEKVHLMVVDDFVFVLNSVDGMKLDYERVVVSISKGIDAFQKFKAHLSQGLLFHILLIDFVMPEAYWTGYKLVTEIRQYEQEVGAPPVFILGLDNDLNDKKLQDAIERGFTDAVEKPLNPTVVNNYIAKAMANMKQ